MFPVFEDQVRTAGVRGAGVPARVCGRCCSRVSATPLLTPGHAPSPAPGKLVLICHDCKEMVLQIIRPGEVAKNQARRLMLAQFARREEGSSL